MSLLFNPPDAPYTKLNYPSHEEVFLREQVALRVTPIFEAHNLVQFSTPALVPASTYPAEQSQRLVDSHGQVWVRCQEPAADFAHFLSESGAKRLKRYDFLQVRPPDCRSRGRTRSTSATWTLLARTASPALMTPS